MKKHILIIALASFTFSCQDSIKKESDVKEEEGTEVVEASAENSSEAGSSENTLGMRTEDHPSLGYWIGYFNADKELNKDHHEMWVDDGFHWNKNNKINISIDRIWEGKVYGHSVVAGNDRPFEGSLETTEGEAGTKIYKFKVKEPGDDQYDGEFEFEIAEGELQGKWTAYKNLKIKHRVYELEKKEFKYDPDVKLEQNRNYMDWGKSIQTSEEYGEGDEMEEWIYTQYSTATQKIYEINASNTLLKKEDVENLKRGDLTIIRNAIYARHGYSFKHKPLRIFFDAQSWYIPVHTNIKDHFTDIEKENIKLLMNYEKNAAEYYDSFGRG
jgi:hypothetical protein